MIGLESLLNKQATIYRSTEYRNQYAQLDIDWNVVSSLKCAVMQQSQTENMNQMKVSDVAGFRVYCRPINVQIDDKLLIDGVYYKVIRVNDVMRYNGIMQIDVEVTDGIYQQDTTV